MVSPKSKRPSRRAPNRRPKFEVIAGAAGALVIAAIASFLAVALVSTKLSDSGWFSTKVSDPSSLRPGPSPTPTFPCATGAQALLTKGDMGGYRLQVNDAFGLPPISTRPGAVPPPAYRTYVGGRLVGFVVEEAYHDPYLSESQSEQRQMGYPVTQTPELPLQGQIVVDMPGILEAYQLNTVFSSPDGAANFQMGQTYGYTDPNDSRVALSGDLGAAVAYYIRPVKPKFEFRYQIDLTLGLIQVDLQFRGGDAMSLAQVSALADNAIHRLQHACHL